MRPGITNALRAVDRRRLEGNRNALRKHVWRAEIVHFSAAGLGTVEIMRRTGKSKTCVWRWQERFAAEGVEGFCATKPAPRGWRRSARRSSTGSVAPTATEPAHEQECRRYHRFSSDSER